MSRVVQGCLALMVFVLAATDAVAAEPKRVLLLHSFGPQFVPWVFFAGQFREELFKQSPDKIDLYEASLEGARFQQTDEQRPIVEYLAALFQNRKLDLIVTIGAPATFFVQQYRAQFFPNVPLVIGAPEQRAIKPGMLTANDAPVPVALNFKKWIESILEVRPDTIHIAWIVGASPLERFWTEEFRRVLAALRKQNIVRMVQRPHLRRHAQARLEAAAALRCILRRPSCRRRWRSSGP